jgi:hypothetical protein
MPKVEAVVDSPLPPQTVREGLLDFSPGRPESWPGIYAPLYEVYEVGDTYADIREGSKVPGGVIWAKEHYDWSDPDTVTWTVRESNFCAPGSYVSARITPAAIRGIAHPHHLEPDPDKPGGQSCRVPDRRYKGRARDRLPAHGVEAAGSQGSELAGAGPHPWSGPIRQQTSRTRWPEPP